MPRPNKMLGSGCMNKKAAAFKKYLDEKQITCFAIEEVADDKLNTAVFRSQIDVEGQQLPTIIILDSSIYGIIRVKLASSALNENNEAVLMKRLNELNRQYKIFKYYLADDGSLFLDSYVLNNSGQVDGDMIYTVLDVIIKHLNAEYKNLMRLIWA